MTNACAPNLYKKKAIGVESYEHNDILRTRADDYFKTRLKDMTFKQRWTKIDYDSRGFEGGLFGVSDFGDAGGKFA